MLFVMSGLGISGPMTFVVAFVLLFVQGVVFQHTYVSLFPVQPHRLRQAKVAPSILLFALQVFFWVVVLVLARYWRANHGT
jgi:hypothetical protein